MIRYFVTFILLVTNFLFAQDIPLTILKSSIFQDDFKDSRMVFAEKDKSDNLIIVRSFKSGVSTSRGLYIGKFDSSLHKINDFKFEIEHPLSEKYSSIIGTFVKDSKVIVVEIFYDLKSKNFVCQAHIINENYEVSKKELFSLHKDEVKGFGIQKIFDDVYDIDVTNETAGNFKIEESPVELISGKAAKGNFGSGSRSEVLMKLNKQKTYFTVALNYLNNHKNYLKLFVFDATLDKKIERTYEDEQNEIARQNLELDNDTMAVYLTEKRYSIDLKDKEEGGKYSYSVRKITNSKEEEINISVKNHYISFLKTFIHKDKVFSVGFYSDEGDFRYGGVCIYEMDFTKLEILKSNYNPFDAQFIIDKYGKLKDKEFKNISLKQIFFNEKDEIFINAEEIYLKSSNINNSNYYNAVIYNHDDIIALKLNSNLDLLYARNINKHQAIIDEDEAAYISYSSFLVNHQNIFFVNANDKVKKLSNDRIEFGSVAKNRSNLNLIVLDEKGNFEIKEVLDDDAEENEVPFMVSKGVMIDESILFFGRRGKKKQLLKITLE